jgi:hypothetical protein
LLHVIDLGAFIDKTHPTHSLDLCDRLRYSIQFVPGAEEHEFPRNRQ